MQTTYINDIYSSARMPLIKFDHSKKMHFRCCGMANGTNEPVQILCKFGGYFNSSSKVKRYSKYRLTEKDNRKR